MDGIKLPVFLLLIVLAIGFTLFNPFAEKQKPLRGKAGQQKSTTEAEKPSSGDSKEALAPENHSKKAITTKLSQYSCRTAMLMITNCNACLPTRLPA